MSQCFGQCQDPLSNDSCDSYILSHTYIYMLCFSKSFPKPGIVLGTANGDPSSLEPNFSPRRSAFGGRLLAVVRPEPRGLGRTMTVRAESPNLTPAELRLKVLGLNSAPEHSDMAVFV